MKNICLGVFLVAFFSTALCKQGSENKLNTSIFTLSMSKQKEDIGLEKYEAILKIKKVIITPKKAWVVFKTEKGAKVKLRINQYFHGIEGLLDNELKITNINFKVQWRKIKILNLKKHSFEWVDELVSMQPV